MDRFDRIFELHKLLSSARQPVTRQRIEQELECSRATAKRIVETMRLYLNAPIRYDRELNGYYYDRDQGEMYELPGIWFNASELHALLSVQQLLTQVQPGLLERQLAPLRERIDQLLKTRQSGGGGLSHRIRILQAAARPSGESFQLVAGALARRRRLKLDYYNRGEDRVTAREVSPQRLVHYRDNWYLDAFCHLRSALRTFALDAVRSARTLQQPAQEVAAIELDEYYSSAYGIFSGRAEQTAVLRFSPKRARWVAAEQWHPQQQTRWLDDGRYELRVPYCHSPELIMDILKYGPEVEVIGPKSLRKKIAARIRQAAALYD